MHAVHGRVVHARNRHAEGGGTQRQPHAALPREEDAQPAIGCAGRDQRGEHDHGAFVLDAEAAGQPALHAARLRESLAALLEGERRVPEDRLAQEVALLATKSDVREELDRLSAHIAEARRLLGSGEAIGRKLDFLTQEFVREANTLCSKSATTALTRLAGRPLTLAYAAPEQVLSLPITVAADVYALGVMLFELLTESRL